MNYLRFPFLVPSLAGLAWLTFAAPSYAGVTVTGGAAPAATAWSGTPIAASVVNPSGDTSVAESFGSGVTSLAQTFTVPVSSSFALDRICLYVGGGTGTSTTAPLTLNLYDLGGEHAPNPAGYTGASLLGGGSGLAVNYTTQPNGVLQFDLTGSDRVTLVAGRVYAVELAGTANTSPLSWLRTITDTYAAGAAYRNASWINGSNARDFALAVYGTAVATPATSSTIDAGVTHQVIDGFGAGTAFLDMGITQLTDAEMDALYGTAANQMALTLMRERISPAGSSDWGDPIANGRKAHQRGAKILATPWTPPAEMKDNGSTIHGSLLPSKYQAYVDYLNSFIDAMAAAGAPIDVISLQNEPDFDPTYEGCQWTAEQFRTFCRDFAGGLKAGVMMPESYSYAQPISDATLNDPAAAANVDYVGGHLYGATIRDYPLAHSLGKHTWMTEYFENDQTIESAVATAQQIQTCLTVGNMSAYIWWKTIGNANGLLDASGTLQHRAYVMGQFSRFVRPGDVRVDVPTNDSSLAITAFKSASTGAVTIVAVNNTAVPITQTFTVRGTSTPSLTPWVTSATESLAVHAAVPVTNGAFAYTIPATTVVTFVGEAPATPVITAGPESHTIATGATVVLGVTATGEPLTYQWRHDSAPVAGATDKLLVISGAQASDAGSYTVAVTNANGTATSPAATLTVKTVSATDAGRISNLSVRTFSGVADQVLNVGFAVGGENTSGTKPLLIRVTGPALAGFGVGGTMTDPMLTVYPLGSSVVTASNDNWSGNATVVATSDAVGAFALTDTASLDAATVTSISPGPYTILAAGKDNGTGIVITEVYDATPAGSVTAATPRLVNVSARAVAGTGDAVLIAGFAISGTTSKTLLIRASGPALASFGVGGTIADPNLAVYRLGGPKLYENDDWGGSPLIANAGAGVRAFAFPDRNSKDAALLVTLPPGAYTAQVSGANGGTGVALIEVYEVP